MREGLEDVEGEEILRRGLARDISYEDGGVEKLCDALTREGEDKSAVREAFEDAGDPRVLACEENGGMTGGRDEELG